MVSTSRTLTLLIIVIFFFLTPPLGARDYYLSYRLYSKAFIASYEHLHISPAMVPFSQAFETICTFGSDAKSFESFAKAERDRLLECLFKHGIIIHAREKMSNLVNHYERLELLFPPTPLQVEINDGLVIIKAEHQGGSLDEDRDRRR